MKAKNFLVLCLGFVSCQKHSVSITESCTLVQNINEYDLVIVYSGSKIDTLKNIDRIGWDKESILFHKNSLKKGWMYIYDAGDVAVKSWGVYSDSEMILRGRELQIENKYNVLPTHEAWELLK